MKINNFLKKILYLLNSNKYYIIMSLISSILLNFYYFYTPFQADNKLLICVYIVPFFIFYVFLVIDILRNLNFIRGIIYPIILFSLFVCMTMSIGIIESDYAELFFFVSIFLFPICLAITEVYAIIQDIKTYKNTSLHNNDK